MEEGEGGRWRGWRRVMEEGGVEDGGVEDGGEGDGGGG